MSKKLIKHVFWAGIFLLPLIIQPGAIVPYEIPKVFFFQSFSKLLGVLSLFLIIAKGLKLNKKYDTTLLLLVAFFLLEIFISSLLGQDLSKSIYGNFYRGDGLITYLHLAIFFLSLTLFWDDSWETATIFSIGISSFFTSLWAVISNFHLYYLRGGFITDFSTGVGGPFGQPNFLAGYLLICLPFTFHLFLKESKTPRKIFWLFELTLQILAIILTFSRASILGIPAFFLGWIGKDFLKREGHFKILPWSVFFLLVLIIFMQALWDKTYKDFSLQAESRERIVVKGLLAFSKKPLLGWGWANFDHAFESVDWPMKLDSDVYVDKAHSNLLEILVTAGILGFIIYLLIIFRTLILLFDKKVFFLTFLLFLFHSQTNVISINEEMMFWLILAIAAGGKKLKNKIS